MHLSIRSFASSLLFFVLSAFSLPICSMHLLFPPSCLPLPSFFVCLFCFDFQRFLALIFVLRQFFHFLTSHLIPFYGSVINLSVFAHQLAFDGEGELGHSFRYIYVFMSELKTASKTQKSRKDSKNSEKRKEKQKQRMRMEGQTSERRETSNKNLWGSCLFANESDEKRLFPRVFEQAL